ncbi:hypothetical protein [Paenibacillus sp. BJ-4]|nr:hypothetical protein [Paenibacillus sp. BJ-4]
MNLPEHDQPAMLEHVQEQIQEMEDRLSEFDFQPGEEVVAFIL